MGVSQAAHIQHGLLSGLPASTPVAIVQNTSLPHQRHAVTTLGNLQHTIHQEQLGSPAVMVVGDVVRGVAAVQGSTRPLHCGPSLPERASWHKFLTWWSWVPVLPACSAPPRRASAA